MGRRRYMKCISALKSIFRVPTALVWPLRTRVIPAQAAANGHTECVRLLVEAGADVEARDNEGKTPAEHAAESMPVRHAVLEVLGQS